MKHATIDEFQGRIVHHHVRCFEKNKQEISVLNRHNVDLTDPFLVFDCICDTLPSIDDLNDMITL